VGHGIGRADLCYDERKQFGIRLVFSHCSPLSPFLIALRSTLLGSELRLQVDQLTEEGSGDVQTPATIDPGLQAFGETVESAGAALGLLVE